MKRVLTPSLFITYPPSPFLFKRGLFLYFLPFLTLDKIKVGGDSCSPQHCCILKIKVCSPSYTFLSDIIKPKIHAEEISLSKSLSYPKFVLPYLSGLQSIYIHH